MPLLIKAGEATAARRRIAFDLRGTDGITPALAEAGGQPQINIDGAGWTDTGVGTLVADGFGSYHADLTSGAVAVAGPVIRSRYKSAATAECPGDTVQVVAFDPALNPMDDVLGVTSGGLTLTNGLLLRAVAAAMFGTLTETSDHSATAIKDLVDPATTAISSSQSATARTVQLYP